MLRVKPHDDFVWSPGGSNAPALYFARIREGRIGGVKGDTFTVDLGGTPSIQPDGRTTYIQIFHGSEERETRVPSQPESSAREFGGTMPSPRHSRNSPKAPFPLRQSASAPGLRLPDALAPWRPAVDPFWKHQERWDIPRVWRTWETWKPEHPAKSRPNSWGRRGTQLQPRSGRRWSRCLKGLRHGCRDSARS